MDVSDSNLDNTAGMIICNNTVVSTWCLLCSKRSTRSTPCPGGWQKIILERFSSPESCKFTCELKVGISYIELDKLPSQEILASVEDRCNQVAMILAVVTMM